jgi:pimeloyl-ACP methyl ester carboxylesterase
MESDVKKLSLPDGRILACAEYGDLSGKPVFLFHGIPGSRFFRPPDEVTQRVGVHLICMDRPGSGLSTYVTGRHIMDWPADVQFLADQMGLGEFHVAGHSGGGPYSLACAYALPHRVLGTAVICGAGPADTKEALLNMTPLNRLAISIGRFLPWSLWRLLVWYFYRRGHRDPAYLFDRAAKDRAHSDSLILADPGILELNYASQSEGLRQGTRGFALEARLLSSSWNIPLEKIQVPVHIWHGTDDVDTPVGMAKALASRVPNSKLTIFPSEAHMLIFPHWEEILRDLISI